MQADIETHSAAISFTPHRRWSNVVGARSELPWNESSGGSEPFVRNEGHRALLLIDRPHVDRPPDR